MEGPSGDEELEQNFDVDTAGEFSLPFPAPRAAPRYDPVRSEETIAEEVKMCWAAAKAFFDGRSLVEDHISSYNNFVQQGIHEMFREAKPFVVDLPDDDSAFKKKVVVSFSGVELSCKPDVEENDRRIEARRSDTDANEPSSSGVDKGKGKGKAEEVDELGRGKMSWFTNEDPVSSNLGENNGAGSSGAENGMEKGNTSWPTDKNPGSLNLGANDKAGGSGEDDACQVEEKNGSRRRAKYATVKGKGHCGGKYVLNVVRPSGEAADGKNGLKQDLEEPPRITEDTRALEDFPRNEDDASVQSGESEDMQIDDCKSSKAGKAGGIHTSPVTSTPEAGNPAGDADDWQDDVAGNGSNSKADGGRSAENDSDPDPSNRPFGKSKRRKPNLKLLPVEARLRGMTYSSPIYVKVKIETQIPVSAANWKKSFNNASSSSRHESVTQEDRVLLGRIPVMVKSSLCHLDGSQSVKGDCCLDPGGYFIIKGSEKVIVAQEVRHLERTWVSHSQGTWTANCTPRRKGFSRYNYHRTLIKLAVPKKQAGTPSSAGPLITLCLVGVEPIPVGVYFSALGVGSDRHILQMICYELEDSELLEVVRPSLLDADRCLDGALKEWNENTFDLARTKRDREVALRHIGSKTLGSNLSFEMAAQDVLKDRLLPHLESNEWSKALFLGYMVRRVCNCYLGRQKATDRDDFKNKRIEFAGEIIGHQIRKLMGAVMNTMKKRIQKHLSKGIIVESAEKYLDDKVVTRGLKAAFSSGVWNSHDGNKISGVVFDLKRGNPTSTLCQLRELRQFVPPSTRIGDEARHPTFSQWGRVCPIDTPDGEDCGLVKNIALTGMISGTTPEEPVRQILTDSRIVCHELVTDLCLFEGACKVFVNGKWSGSLDADDGPKLVGRLKDARRTVPVNATQPDLTQVEVAADIINGEIHISTDAGRVLRPLLIVEDEALVLNNDHVKYLSRLPKSKRFRWLLQKGVVELLGIEEEEKAMIALHGEDLWKAKAMRAMHFRAPVFTHAELHPSLILGLSASVIPFPNRNQSSRNLFQAHKHSKQAIGFYVTNINSRADTAGQNLFYPQMQLVKTNTFACLQRPEIFSGQNAIVAVACYTGYNQEDSIIMDQSALDRGMFRTTHYRTVRTEEHSDYETFGKPTDTQDGGAKLARSIENLDEDGLPRVGCNLGVGDVIVGKTSKVQRNITESLTRMTDPSQRLKAHEKGRVDQVMLVQDDDGNKVAKVKLRETRMPQVGDKFSSMHGQKGILGMVFTQEDLPFTAEGIVPDIVINPHAFPTRQTLGQMCESAVGKVVAKTGQTLFATPFNPSASVESIANALHRAGYERWGNETMYNGFTGQAMEAKIFIGTTFYQRLTHMVEDKIKFRSRGHVHPLTRQPVADRKRHGGVKFGEMERDCLIAHGAAATLQERSFVLSDFHTVHVCTNCEQLANWNADRLPECRMCSKKRRTSIVTVELPYACKLLMQELMSMGISVRLKTERQ